MDELTKCMAEGEALMDDIGHDDIKMSSLINSKKIEEDSSVLNIKISDNSLLSDVEVRGD